DEHVYGSFHETFPVMEGDRLVGSISVGDLRDIDRANWERLEVREAMHPLSRLTAIEAHENGEAALRIMREGGNGRLIVVSGDRLVGIVALRDIMRLLRLKEELGPRTGGTTSKSL
ncbi:MAG: CBS domain-containing protein, partial [Parvibaculum sp.]